MTDEMDSLTGGSFSLNRVGLPVLGRSSVLVDAEYWDGLSSNGKPTWKSCQTRIAVYVRDGSGHTSDRRRKRRRPKRKLQRNF